MSYQCRHVQIVQHDVSPMKPSRALAYIDDTIGAALPHLALAHYSAFTGTMATLGLDLAPDKGQPPTTCLTWIGVTYDSVAMTMAIDQAQIAAVIEACHSFLDSIIVNKMSMEKFLGRIFHTIKCTEGARRFTARLLALLGRATYDQHTVIDPSS